jgi:hypothetical protein
MKYIPIRFPDLDKYAHYTFKPDLDIAALYFKGCTLPNQLMGETKLFSLKSVTKGQITITIPKGVRLGHIQSPEPPHYSAILPVSIHKISPCNVEKPQSLARSSTVTSEVASTDVTSLRQVSTKTSSPLGSALVSPKRARYPRSLRRTSVPSFSPVHSFLSPIGWSPFFFFYWRLLFSHPLLWQSPLGIPCDCQNVLFIPPKPGWQRRTKELSLCLC